jgi:hypothetical protein
MTSRTLVLTFDYELFFGRSGTVTRCIIAPVDALLAELAAARARACFFVDATHLVRMLEEPRAADDAARVGDQIGRLVAAGHRAELHVHPQWLDAAWSGDGTWEFRAGGYRSLADLDQGLVVDLMTSGAEALLRAARAAVPGYTLEAFRAPGLCAQPFTAIAAGMKALGLTIDSSVAPGTALRTASYSYDYRGAPDGPCWRFDSDPMQPAESGQFAELPVSCMPGRLSTKALRRAERKLRADTYRPFGDGGFFSSGTSLSGRLRSTVSSVGLEATSPLVMRRVLAHAPDTVTFITHPKSMSKASLASLRWLARQGNRFALPGEVVAERLEPQGSSPRGGSQG